MSKNRQLNPDKGLEKWQGSRRNGSWNKISNELVDSPAWNALTKKQQNLYILTQRLRYWAITAAGRKKESPRTPTTRWNEYEKVTDDTFYIRFVEAVANKKYKKYDEKTFYYDRKVLVLLGFLDIVIDGKAIGYKADSVYKMSSRWQKIQDSEIAKMKKQKLIGSKPIFSELDLAIQAIYGGKKKMH
nr:hypothetical protein [uncultured Dialister sp.]